MNINLHSLDISIIEEMKQIWFIADVHHGHPKAAVLFGRPVKAEEFEGEASIENPSYKRALSEAHNKWLIDEVLNKWIKRKHTVYFLGDLSLAKKEEADKFIDKINGNKFLIAGNHDGNILTSTRFSQITQRKDFRFKRPGIDLHIVLDHFPIASWNRKVHGSWHLYGHVHGRFANNGLSMDVGLDSKELLQITGGVYRPINLFEVVQYMNDKIDKFTNDVAGLMSKLEDIDE